MNSARHSGFPAANAKPAINLLGWIKAKLRDVMIAAEVLHDIQWAAPWDKPTRPQ